MLLSTFILLTTVFTAFLITSKILPEQFRVGTVIAALGLLILGLTLIADDRGLVVRQGETTLIQNQTGGDVQETTTNTYEEISTGLTQFLQFGTLLTGLTLLYSARTLYVGKEGEREFERKTR